MSVFSFLNGELSDLSKLLLRVIILIMNMILIIANKK